MALSDELNWELLGNKELIKQKEELPISSPYSLLKELEPT